MKRILTLCAVATSVGCASGTAVEVGPQGVFDGLAYWEFPGLVDEQPYAFHWYGSAIRIWNPEHSGSEPVYLELSKCEGLRQALDDLMNTIPESAEILADIRPPLVINFFPSHSEPGYRLRVYPYSSLGSLTFTALDSVSVPWVSAATHVKGLAQSCLSV